MLSDIITLVHHSGARVICEGVETERQVAMLSEIGCDMMQGYYFSRVIPNAHACSRPIGSVKTRRFRNRTAGLHAVTPARKAMRAICTGGTGILKSSPYRRFFSVFFHRVLDICGGSGYN